VHSVHVILSPFETDGTSPRRKTFVRFYDATEMLDVSKQSVVRRLQELEGEGRVERWKVGSRAVVWWLTEES